MAVRWASLNQWELIFRNQLTTTAAVLVSTQRPKDDVESAWCHKHEKKRRHAVVPLKFTIVDEKTLVAALAEPRRFCLLCQQNSRCFIDSVCEKCMQNVPEWANDGIIQTAKVSRSAPCKKCEDWVEAIVFVHDLDPVHPRKCVSCAVKDGEGLWGEDCDAEIVSRLMFSSIPRAIRGSADDDMKGVPVLSMGRGLCTRFEHGEPGLASGPEHTRSMGHIEGIGIPPDESAGKGVFQLYPFLPLAMCPVCLYLATKAMKEEFEGKDEPEEKPDK